MAETGDDQIETALTDGLEPSVGFQPVSLQSKPGRIAPTFLEPPPEVARHTGTHRHVDGRVILEENGAPPFGRHLAFLRRTEDLEKIGASLKPSDLHTYRQKSVRVNHATSRLGNATATPARIVIDSNPWA